MRIKRPRQIGTYWQGDGTILIVHKAEYTRDGIASQTIKADAVAQAVKDGVIVRDEDAAVQLPVVPELVSKDQAKDAARAITTALPGKKFGTLITLVAEELRLDDTDVDVRSEIASILNKMARRGDLRRDDDDKWWPE